MKTILGRHDKDGYVVVKIFVKPELGMSLSKRVKKLKGLDILQLFDFWVYSLFVIVEYKALSDVHNAFSFQRILETDKAAYLVRQYLYSNLYDRIRYDYVVTLSRLGLILFLVRDPSLLLSRKNG